MIRTIASGWAAAIVATLIAADVYGQEPPPQGIDFESVIAAARARRRRSRAGQAEPVP